MQVPGPVELDRIAEDLCLRGFEQRLWCVVAIGERILYRRRLFVRAHDPGCCSQENAELLTEEGKLLQQIQGNGVIDYDIDAYATRLSEILDRKVNCSIFRDSLVSLCVPDEPKLSSRVYIDTVGEMSARRLWEKTRMMLHDLVSFGSR